MTLRRIKRIVTGATQYDGAGVQLVRVIGGDDVQDFDPFLMLDAFDSDNPEDYTKGFPWHPHRGIETVTYLIEGDIEHGDSMGNKGSILDGCCQWMTAGSGILHQEMPLASKRMLGAQLWVNLPMKDKMTKPKYRDINRETIPIFENSTGTVRVISGRYKETEGATRGDYVDINYLDVELNPGQTWTLETVEDHTLFIYIVEGEGYFAGDDTQVVTNKRALLFSEGETFEAKATGNGLRFLLLSGAPLREPIAWGGPIVMNTRDELMQAFQELDKGTFIK